MIAFLALFPHNIKLYAMVAVCMIAVDTITGVWAAAACRQLRSSTMRERLCLKLNQYLIILLFGGVMSAITESWWFLQSAFWAIISIEAFSLIESLIRIEKVGGQKLTVVSQFLNVASVYFDGETLEDRRKQSNESVVSKITVETAETPTHAATKTTSVTSIPTHNTTTDTAPPTPLVPPTSE